MGVGNYGTQYELKQGNKCSEAVVSRRGTAIRKSNKLPILTETSIIMDYRRCGGFVGAVFKNRNPGQIKLSTIC